MTKYEIQVSEDKSSLALAASDLITQIIESTLKNKTRAKISLCGGSTPKAAYSLFCLLYTSPSPRDGLLSRMPSSA